jgi:hypothetical protein
MKQILTGVLLIISIFRLTGSDGYRRSPGIDIINYTFSLLLSDSSDMIYGRSVITMRFKEVTVSMQFDLKNTRVDGKGMVVDSVLYNGGLLNGTKETGSLLFPTGLQIKMKLELSALYITESRRMD